MKNTYKLTKSSIMTSLTVMLFILCRLISTADLSLLTLSSLLICISIIKFGSKHSLLIVVSSIISSLILGVIEYSIIYLIFFGSYPLIKFYIERLNNIKLELTLKILYFNVIFLPIFFIYSKLFFPIKITSTIMLMGIFIFSTIFVVYDLFLTRIITLVYSNDIIRKL